MLQDGRETSQKPIYHEPRPGWGKTNEKIVFSTTIA